MANRQISAMWEIFGVGDETVLEIRCIRPQGGPARSKLFRREEYKCCQDLKDVVEIYALQQNKAGYNIYIVMNEIRADFNVGSARDVDIVLFSKKSFCNFIFLFL